MGLRKASRPRWLKGPLRHGGRIPASASPPRPVSAECVGLFMPSGLAVEDSPSPWSYDPSCGLLSTESPQACYRLGRCLAGFSGAGGELPGSPAPGSAGCPGAGEPGGRPPPRGTQPGSAVSAATAIVDPARAAPRLPGLRSPQLGHRKRQRRCGRDGRSLRAIADRRRWTPTAASQRIACGRRG